MHLGKRSVVQYTQGRKQHWEDRCRKTPAQKVKTTVPRPEGRLTSISPCYCTREEEAVVVVEEGLFKANVVWRSHACTHDPDYLWEKFIRVQRYAQF